MIGARPLAGHSLTTAGLLYDGLVVGLKEALPAHVEPRGKVPHVKQSFLLELIADRRLQLTVDASAVDHRGTPAFLGRQDAEETDPRGPSIHVRAFVVVQ